MRAHAAKQAEVVTDPGSRIYLCTDSYRYDQSVMTTACGMPAISSICTLSSDFGSGPDPEYVLGAFPI